MTAKHPKLNKPTNVDLMRNPLIGGSKGMTRAQAAREDLEELEGENTIEGDLENDAGLGGGVQKIVKSRSRRRREDRATASRKPPRQGKKTHEQQLRILERKPDMPDQRQLEQDVQRVTQSQVSRMTHPEARQSEFPVGGAGMNQESKHNKRNRQSKAGRKRPSR